LSCRAGRAIKGDSRDDGSAAIYRGSGEYGMGGGKGGEEEWVIKKKDR